MFWFALTRPLNVLWLIRDGWNTFSSFFINLHVKFIRRHINEVDHIVFFWVVASNLASFSIFTKIHTCIKLCYIYIVGNCFPLAWFSYEKVNCDFSPFKLATSRFSCASLPFLNGAWDSTLYFRMWKSYIRRSFSQISYTV